MTTNDEAAITDVKNRLQAMIEKPHEEFVDVTRACEDNQFQALATKYLKSKSPDAATLDTLSPSQNAE